MRLFVVGIVFGQHSHTLGPSINWMLKVRINEKSIFVDPSHRFCLSTYDASEGFGLFSDNTHTLWCFLKIIWVNEKSVFVEPSHTFCLSRYDASDGFGLFSDNTHTLCGFLKTYESMKNLFSLTPLTHSVCLDMMLLMALVCFRTTLTHFVSV